MAKSTIDTLIMTAAVEPSHQFRNEVNCDNSLRRRQYAKAVTIWADFVCDRRLQLIFLELADSNLESIKNEIPRRAWTSVEFVKIPPSDIDLQRGKGAVESSGIDALIGQGAVAGAFCKVTGRLIVSNASKAIPDTLASQLMVRRTIDNRWVDTRLFCVTSDTWRAHLTGMSSGIDDVGGVFVEHEFARRIRSCSLIESVSRFPRRPILVGESGTTGNRYRQGYSPWVEPIVRRLEGAAGTFAARKQW